MPSTLALAALLLLLAAIATPALAQDTALRDLINGLGEGNYAETEKQVNALAATGDTAAVPALEALADGNLYVRKSDGVVFITEEAGSNLRLIDPLTGETVGEEPKGAIREDQGQQQAPPRHPLRDRRADADEPRRRGPAGGGRVDLPEPRSRIDRAHRRRARRRRPIPPSPS